MGRSKIEIRAIANGYYFEVLPGNNHSQPLGISPEYKTYSECDEAKTLFHNLMIENQIDSIYDSHITSNISQRAANSYLYQIKDDFGKEVFSSRHYKDKKQCRLGVARVFKILSEN